MRPFRSTAFIAAMFATTFTSPVTAQDVDAETQAYLASLEETLGGKLMNDPTTLDFETYGEADFKTKQVSSAEAPGGAAYRVTIKSPGKNPWDAAVQMELSEGVAVGDSISVAFYARAAKTPKGSDTGYLTARMQKKTEPYTGIVEQGFEVGEAWELYEIKGTSQNTFDADAINLGWNVGDRKQTIEIGQVFVVNHTAK